jgi:hypothetical protein
MLSAKLITSKIFNVLQEDQRRVTITLFVSLLLGITASFSQDNSPYSRYGMGDMVPSTNVNSRGMGGISSGLNDFLSINFNNPASYGSFQTLKEATAKKIAKGRAILDVGLNFENRTLREPNSVGKFSASNALFSHVQIGLPIRPNWGLSFGLRPLSRVSYKLAKREQLIDPQTGLAIDSAVTQNEGDGGSYLASLGLGHRIKLGGNNSLSLGVNGGYFFGKQDYSTRRAIFNDSITYTSGNFQTVTSYGNLYFNAGMQFQVNLKKDFFLTIGAQGNWQQTIDASRDIIRETYYYDENSGNVRIDSVLDQKNIKGNIIYPASYTAGFVLERFLSAKKAGWLFGIDYTQSKWSDYRSYGVADPSIKDKWELRAGFQLRPIPKTNYFSNVSYRAGVFFGPDYIQVGKKLPVFGTTVGMGLPLRNYNRQNEQFTLINLAFEFIRRGNNDNVLKENLFRLSAGFSLSDLWFLKRKYD